MSKPIDIPVLMTAKPKAVANHLANYWSTYNDQLHVENYSAKTVLNDGLYGLGIAMSEEYQCADGFQKFMRDLQRYLDEEVKPCN